MKLGEAEPLGAVNHHHGRVWHVDAHLDNRRRNENVKVSTPERLHHVLFLPQGHPAVQQPDAKVRKLHFRKPFILLHGRLCLKLFGLVDKGAHDERLVSPRQSPS